MPVSFFLKLFSRLASLAMAVLFVCFLAYWGVNTVRQQAWQEAMATPLMDWLAQSPAMAGHYPWLTQFYDYDVRQVGELNLSLAERERLEYGHTLVVSDALGAMALSRRDDGLVLSLRLRNFYQDTAEATALMALWHLNQTGPADRREASELLAEALGVRLLQTGEGSRQLPPEEVLQRISERPVAFYTRDAQGQVVLRLKSGALVDMVMPGEFQRASVPVLLLLLGLAGLVIALAVRLLMQDVEKNLRSVESVAVRIARGELDARVEPGQSTLVSRLGTAFNSMADQIQRLVGVQREMIHAVSHELRTPVARIRFGVQMIESARTPEALQKQLDGIDGDIQELDELIDEILTYARLEQGGPVFSLRTASVTDLVRQVIEEQRVIHPGIQLEAVIPPQSDLWQEADVEPRYIHRALQNLVGNACRYASAEVRVTCQLDEENCRIDVEDDGPGIPEEDWEKVFSAFARLDDSRTRTSGGYGLGLSIVRRILFWHGGQSFVGRSDDLGGARFSLVWPRKQDS